MFECEWWKDYIKNVLILQQCLSCLIEIRLIKSVWNWSSVHIASGLTEINCTLKIHTQIKISEFFRCRNLFISMSKQISVSNLIRILPKDKLRACQSYLLPISGKTKRRRRIMTARDSPRSHEASSFVEIPAADRGTTTSTWSPTSPSRRLPCQWDPN